MNVQYDLVVDFARPSKSNSIIISENDDRSRVCHFILLNDKQPFSMSDVVVAQVNIVKPDKTKIIDTKNVEILKDESDNFLNEIMYTIPIEITNQAGNVQMTIELNSISGERITSFDFYLLVRNSLYKEEDIVSQDTIDGFRDLLIESQKTLEELKKYAQEGKRPNPFSLGINIEGDKLNYDGSAPVEFKITNVAYINDDVVIETDALDESSVAKCAEYAEQCESAKEVAERGAEEAAKAIAAAQDAQAYASMSAMAEAWAVGTINGTPVEPGAEQYNNNALYWAGLSRGDISFEWADVNGKPFESLGEGLEIDSDHKLNVVSTGTDVTWDQLETGGTHIADITIDGNKTEIYAPTGGSGAGTYASLPDKPSINGITLENNIDITVPTMLSELESDSTHRLVSDNQITAWNNRDYYNIANKPYINNKLINSGNNIFKLRDLDDVNYGENPATGSVLYYASNSWVSKKLSTSMLESTWEIDREFTGSLSTCINDICYHIKLLKNAVGNANELLEGAL